MPHKKNDVRAREKLVAFVLLTAFVIFFLPLLGGKNVLFFRDSLLLDLPFKWFYRGHFTWRPAFWNPMISLGYPSFAAPHHGIFYPMQILVLLGDFVSAFNGYVIVHYLFGLFFTYWLGRALGATRSGAILAAFVYAFSGFSISRIYEVNRYASQAWIPGVMLAFVKAMQGRSLRWLTLGALLTGLQVLGGEPHFTIFLFLMLFAYALTLKKPLLACFHASAMCGLGLGLAAIQILPSLELAPYLLRSENFSFSEATEWSFHPLRLTDFFFPLFFGNISPSPNYYWGKFVYQHLYDLPFTITAYLGLVPICVIFSQNPLRMKKPARFWLGLGILGLLLSFGKYLPGYALVRHLPVLSLLRYPEKFLLIPCLCWAICAALLWPDFLQQIKRSFLFTLGLLVLFGLTLLVHPIIFSQLKSIIPPAQYHQGLWISYTAIIHAIVIVAVLNLLLAFLHYSKRETLTIALVLLLSFLDLYWVGKQILFTAPADFLNEKPPWLNEATTLQEGRFFREPNLQAKGPLRVLDDSFLLAETRVGMLSLRPNVGLLWGISHTAGYDGLNLAQTQNLLTKSTSLRSYLRQSGSNWYLSDKLDAVPEALELVVDSANYGIKLWKNPEALPRAFLVTQPAAVDGQKISFDAESPKVFPAVKWLKDDAEEIIFKAAAREKSYLVLNDSYYPSWKVEVDGHEENMLLANHYARAVALSPGEHLVRFHFQSKSIDYGGLISFFSLLFIMGIMLKPPRVIFPEGNRDP